MQVRILPPQLKLEVIRPDEEPASKAGVPMNRDCGFESHGFRLIDDDDSGSWSNRKTSVLQTEDSGAIPGESIFQLIRSCSPAAKAASLQEEERWFESTQDHCDETPKYASRLSGSA
jgi:hypothetical protein